MPQLVEIPFLLPHEVLHALYEAGDVQFARSMTGNLGASDLRRFWQHCHQMTEWREHPVLNDPKVNWESSTPALCHLFYSVVAPSYGSKFGYWRWDMSTSFED